MSNIAIEVAIQKVVEHTDQRIVNWYKEAKRAFGVIGSGTTHYNKANNEIVVEYVENGEQKTWSMAFYPEYLENGINWVFDCWGELA